MGTLRLPAAAPAAPPAPEASSLAFGQRYYALQHGGIVRAANSSATCRTNHTPSCADVQAGAQAVNGDFDMFYIDVDRDSNTYNSSRAEVRLPSGSRVTYARLYWGGNLRVGEQKPAQDNGRVLIAEPGGDYKELLADTVVGHDVADGADAFQASADVTGLVRDSGPGLYTVADVNVAAGRSAAGAWGGWTLVVAYENPTEPLRHLSLWDGFAPLGAARDPRSGSAVWTSRRARRARWDWWRTTATAAPRATRSPSPPAHPLPPRRSPTPPTPPATS